MNNSNDLPQEVWKEVPGYEDYDVSNMGRVRSNKYTKARILKTGLKSDGYQFVVLCREGKSHQTYIHHLVAETFIGPRPAGKLVLHNDGSRTNCTVENLRYGTHRENYDDSVVHGTAFKPNKLTWKKVRFIRALRRQGYKYAELGQMFGVHAAHIGQVVRNEIWVEAV